MRRFRVQFVTEIDFVDGEKSQTRAAGLPEASLGDRPGRRPALPLRTIKGVRVETVSVTEIKDEL